MFLESQKTTLKSTNTDIGFLGVNVIAAKTPLRTLCVVRPVLRQREIHTMSHVLHTLSRARPLASLAALLLCATLAACGGDSDSSANPSTPPAGGGNTPDTPTVTPQMKCAP